MKEDKLEDTRLIERLDPYEGETWDMTEQVHQSGVWDREEILGFKKDVLSLENRLCRLRKKGKQEKGRLNYKLGNTKYIVQELTDQLENLSLTLNAAEGEAELAVKERERAYENVNQAYLARDASNLTTEQYAKAIGKFLEKLDKTEAYLAELQQERDDAYEDAECAHIQLNETESKLAKAESRLQVYEQGKLPYKERLMQGYENIVGEFTATLKNGTAMTINLLDRVFGHILKEKKIK